MPISLQSLLTLVITSWVKIISSSLNTSAVSNDCHSAWSVFLAEVGIETYFAVLRPNRLMLYQVSWSMVTPCGQFLQLL
jgi:hypothetical protein